MEVVTMSSQNRTKRLSSLCRKTKRFRKCVRSQSQKLCHVLVDVKCQEEATRDEEKKERWRKMKDDKWRRS